MMNDSAYQNEKGNTSHMDAAWTAKRSPNSPEESDRKEFVAGLEAGEKWSHDGAEYTELRNLMDLRNTLLNEPQKDWDSYFEENDLNAYSVARRVASTILKCRSADDFDEVVLDYFWKCYCGINSPSSNFVKGFSEGALNRFDVGNRWFRESREKWDLKGYASGLSAGARWAAQNARPMQFMDLLVWHNDFTDDGLLEWHRNFTDVASVILHRTFTDSSTAAQETQEFWHSLGVTDFKSGAW